MSTITETVYRTRQYDSDVPPESLSDFIGFFKELAEQIPAEFLANAKVDISKDYEYDSAYWTIEVSYWRPMTKEEKKDRNKAAKTRREQIEAADRAQYEILRQRFEPMENDK